MFSNFYLEPPAWLISNILDLRETSKGDFFTNGTGWRGNELFKGIKEFDPIVEHLEKLANGKVLRYWVNVNGLGQINTWHNHYTASRVGVWYLQTCKDTGDIEFKVNDTIHRYVPASGDFIVFPGTLDHRVLENKTDIARISIAFNFQQK